MKILHSIVNARTSPANTAELTHSEVRNVEVDVALAVAWRAVELAVLEERTCSATLLI